MPTSNLAPQLTCTQCGGVLAPAEGEIFLTCPYCRATVYLDKSRVVFHWAVAPTLSVQDAQASLRRWMAGNQTVKDLDAKSTINGYTFQYFPIWHLTIRAQERETVYLEPATATAITEIKRLSIPAGDLKPYTSSLDQYAMPPDMPYQSVLERLRERGIDTTDMAECSLVHMPLYTWKYTFGGRSYTAVVDAAAGGVFANIFPAKWEVPYLAVAGLALAGYFCANLMPGAGYLIDPASGLMFGSLACAAASVLWAVPVLAVALYVSRKV